MQDLCSKPITATGPVPPLHPGGATQLEGQEQHSGVTMPTKSCQWAQGHIAIKTPVAKNVGAFNQHLPMIPSNNYWCQGKPTSLPDTELTWTGKGSGTLFMAKCPLKNYILSMWNINPLPYSVILCKAFRNWMLQLWSRAFWIPWINHTSQWGNISCTNYTFFSSLSEIAFYMNGFILWKPFDTNQVKLPRASGD